MKEIYIKTLMNETTNCEKQDAQLCDAISDMVEHEMSCIIIEQDKIPLGIITERDLVKILNSDLKKIDLSRPVSDFMTSPVLRLRQDETLFDALVVSKAERVRHLPVVDETDKLVGMVTQVDLANAHYHVTELQAEMIEKAIAEKTDVLQKLNDELQALSMEDHLMEIGNRRAMEVDLMHIHAGALRYNEEYSVLLIDLDMFKPYNDHYGHQMGDDVLKQVANTLKSNIRKSDRLYRYGGEELLVILPHTNTQQLEIASTKLVNAIANEKILHEKNKFGIVTISGGAACVTAGDSTFEHWENLVEVADQCLYIAKQQGRNQSIVATQSVCVKSKPLTKILQLKPRLANAAKTA